MTAAADIDLTQLIDDPAYFAEVAVGEPLWEYQAEFARSPARYRVMCAGRQVGKSRTLAICALHTAYTRANVRVLVISNGEDSSLRVLADCAALARRSPLLSNAVLDDRKQLLTLGNGSTIQSIPASEARARGDSIDLLIVDEAGFISMALWQAAEPSILAKPGSRVILASTPWGKPDHFFRQHYRDGFNTPTEHVAAWHWPSHISPIADQTLLDKWERSWSTIKFKTEILAEWVDDTGSFFSMSELDDAVADYTLTDPVDAHGQLVSAGVDWGMSDAHALVTIGVLDDQDHNTATIGEELVYFIPWLEYHHGKQYSWMVERLLEVGHHYQLHSIVSEVNGVGAMPSEVLKHKLYRDELSKVRTKSGRWTRVIPLTTDIRFKMSAFGAIKILLQQGRLILPNHTELLKQLHNLEYTMTESGQLKISVPDNAGHDDVAMALAFAVSTADGHAFARRPDNPKADHQALLTTGLGTKIPVTPRCLYEPAALSRARGRDKGDGW